MKLINLSPVCGLLLDICLHRLLGKFQLIVLVCNLFELVIERLDLSLGIVDFLLSISQIIEHVRLRLIGSLEQLRVKFGISLEVLDFSLLDSKLFLSGLKFSLLVLKTIGQKKRLLDASLSSCWGLTNGLNQGIANGISAIFIWLLGGTHDSLVKLLFDHVVVSESLLGNC